MTTDKDFSGQILEHLTARNYQPKKVRQLAKALGVADTDYDTFRGNVDRLRQTGRLIFGAKNAVMLPRMSDRFVGTYRANPRGFGFVVPVEPGTHEDLYIPEGENLDAITGDIVAAKVIQGPREGKGARGRIVEIVSRGFSRFVGTVIQVKDRYFVEPDGKQFTDLIAVGDLSAKNARLNDKVVVELTQYPDKHRLAEGVIVEVLGARGEPGVDTLTVLRQFHIPDRFNAAVMEEAGQQARTFAPESAAAGRTDLRDEFVVTIDPATARDFDDAISLKRLDDGGWRLGVHIADVAHFVPPGSALDGSARERGNSVYFVDLVVPMLPEVLSNGVCSLRPDEDRLVKSAYITYDAAGRVRKEEYYNAVIRSNCRLNYEQAQSVIDGRPDADIPADVVALVAEMNRLARTIFDRRYGEGMLHLDLPDVELILDDQGKVVDARPEDSSFSHTLIEMFMVEANEAVARLLNRLNVPFIRRIHPEPEEQDQQKLATFVRICGHRIPKKLDRSSMQRLLKNAQGTPESYAINMALLRSFEQAVYSPADEGHFALASRHYTHFTSPIRRYPDLTIHRLLDQYFAGDFAGKKGARKRAAMSNEELVTLGKHCSMTERRADQAERELNELKVLTLLADHVGDHLYGVVDGVANIGVYVQCSRYLIDGLIRFNDLTDDWWELDARSGAVVGQRSGKRIQIGDLVEVQIIDVDIARRELDLRLIGDFGRKARIEELMSNSPTAAPGAAGQADRPAAGPRPGRGGLDKPGGQRKGDAPKPGQKSHRNDRHKGGHKNKGGRKSGRNRGGRRSRRR
ncbi:MAG: Ribonuclease R [Phycisphaerae bacterium]|nr:Ribonuclease R [Phycisphaerae bacterium]